MQKSATISLVILLITLLCKSRSEDAAARGRFDSPLLHMSEEARSKKRLNVKR